MNNEYLMLLGKGNLYPLMLKFRELGGFYTGKMGWAFPEKSKSELQSVIGCLPGYQIHTIPLGKGLTFEGHRQTYSAQFFMKCQKALLAEYKNYPIDKLSFDEIQELLLDEESKDALIEAASEYSRLSEAILHAEGMAKILHGQKNETKPLKLQFISQISEDYFKEKPPEKPRLLYYVKENGIRETFLHREITGMLVAEGGRGKTHLLSLLACSVATGIPWLSKIEVEEPGTVCFAVGENNDADMRRLLWKDYHYLKEVLEKNAREIDAKRFALHYKDPLDHLAKKLLPITVHGMNAHFIDKHGLPTIFYRSFLDQLIAIEPDGGFKLIVLDPLSRFAGPDAEKDNAMATVFISLLERISEELQGHPTILLSHHKSKIAIKEKEGSQTDARGSSGFTDGARWQAGLRGGDGEDKTLSIFEVTKTNFTAHPQSFKIKKRYDGIPEFCEWVWNEKK